MGFASRVAVVAPRIEAQMDELKQDVEDEVEANGNGKYPINDDKWNNVFVLISWNWGPQIVQDWSCLYHLVLLQLWDIPRYKKSSLNDSGVVFVPFFHLIAGGVYDSIPVTVHIWTNL